MTDTPHTPKQGDEATREAVYEIGFKAGYAAGQAQSKVDIQRIKDAVMIIGSLPYAFDVRHPAHPHPLGLQSLYEMGVGDLFEDDAKRLNRIVKADLERVAEGRRRK